MLQKLTTAGMYRLLFFLLPVIYFLLYGFHGFCDTDQGFIPALSYRISLGEIPHLDFIYVRPPLSPILHSLELWLLPENLEMLGTRFFFFFYVWLSVFLSLKAFQKFLDFEKMGISVWLLGAFCYVITVHNFPPMPWHTLDGILMASIGFFVMTRGPKLYWTIPGLIILSMSALAKQPYGIAPIVGSALLFFLYERRLAILSVLGTAALGLGALFVVDLATPDTSLFGTLMGQVSGVTSLQDLRFGAYQRYVRPVVLSFLPITVLWAILRFRMPFPKADRIVSWVIWLGFIAMAIGHVVFTWKEGTFMPPRLGFYHALLFGGMITAVFFWWDKIDRKAMALLLAMGAIDWASGISWGFVVPVLYSTPAVVGIVYFLLNGLEYKPSWWYFPSIVAALFIGFFLMYQYPYREPHRSELTHNIGEIFPKMNHIYTHKAMYDKFGELDRMHRKWGDNFTVLPAFPIANYVTNTRPAIHVDWAHDAEINYDFGMKKILARMDATQPYVFMEKGKEIEAYSPDTQYRSSLTRHVLENWTAVDSSEYFIVFEHPGR